jgi:hypothetical protein
MPGVAPALPVTPAKAAFLIVIYQYTNLMKLQVKASVKLLASSMAEIWSEATEIVSILPGRVGMFPLCVCRALIKKSAAV